MELDWLCPHKCSRSKPILGLCCLHTSPFFLVVQLPGLFTVLTCPLLFALARESLCPGAVCLYVVWGQANCLTQVGNGLVVFPLAKVSYSAMLVGFGNIRFDAHSSLAIRDSSIHLSFGEMHPSAVTVGSWIVGRQVNGPRQVTQGFVVLLAVMVHKGAFDVGTAILPI